MMYRFDSAGTFGCVVLLLYQLADSSSFPAENNAPLYFGSRSKAKTCCNCTLVAGELADPFEPDDIAVSFSVTVNAIRNKTSEDSRRFILVRDIRAKFLLALPDDSEILSLTTLRHSVQTNSIQMHPKNNSDCFKSLDPMCQDAVIVAAFYNSDKFHVPEGQLVCFPPSKEKNGSQFDKSNIVHRCCTWQRGFNAGYVNCSTVIHLNKWVLYAILAVQVQSALLFLLAPLLFKYLPTRDTQIVRRSKTNATGPRRLGYSNYLALPVDSVTTNRKLLTLDEPLSFVTCGGDEGQPCYSRFCRVIGLFVFPVIFCTFVLLFMVSKKNTTIRNTVTYYTGLVGFLSKRVEYCIFAAVSFTLFVLGSLLLIPGRLSGVGKILSGRRDERTFLGFSKPEQYINHYSGKTGFQFMQSNMVFHLKCCFALGFWLFLLKIIVSPCTRLMQSCCCPGQDSGNEQSSESGEEHKTPTFCLVLGFIFLPFVMSLWIPFVVFCFVVYVTPVGYVAFRLFRVLYSQDIPFRSDCCGRLPFCIRAILVAFLYLIFIIFCTFVLGSYVLVTLMFGAFLVICENMFIYTLIGLSFNVQFFVPYTVLGFFVVFYVWRAISHYFSVYENLRIVVFEECEKYEQQEPMSIIQQTSSPSDSSSISSQNVGPGLLLLDINNNPSIPLNLYVAVYRRLRPRCKTFLTIIAKLLLTLVYLSMAFAAIMSLNEAEDTSTYVQAVFLCATCALPLVLFTGSFTHGKQRRKELEYQVRYIIHRYVMKLEKTGENTLERQTVEPSGSVECLPPNNDMYDI